MSTNGHLKLNLVIGIIRLNLPQVPLDAWTPHHDPTEPIIQSLSGRHYTHVHRSLLPDTIIGH